MSKEYTALEIATEVAWQVGEALLNLSRAENRWYICDLTQRIIKEGIITKDSEDIDEIIGAWLIENGEG